jgi:hypothetical protein
VVIAISEELQARFERAVAEVGRPADDDSGGLPASMRVNYVNFRVVLQAIEYANKK